MVSSAHEQRYASPVRGARKHHGAARGTDERNAGDQRRRAREQWEAPGGAYCSGSGGDCSRRPQKLPRGSSALSERSFVHFISAGIADPSRPEPDHSCNFGSPAPGPKATSAPEPGILASNSKVAKMMMLMNYKEGTGLGKHGQGIIAPIEAIMRPKNAGLGTCEGPFHTGGADSPPPNADNWPKWGDAGGARTRDQESGEQSAAPEAASRAQKMLERGSRTAGLLRDEGALDDVEEMENAFAAITKAMTLAQEERASGTLTSTGELICEFMRLKEKFPEEYKTYCLADAAVTLVAPLLRSVFQRWEPLREPSCGLDVVRLLKSILEDASARSPYAVLVNDIVVTAVLKSAWKARDPEPMVRFMETWGDTLPPSAVQRILEKAVVPKLADAVESWEPGWEDVPCHVWVRPWIPHLGHLLESVYGTVRHKLECALREWDVNHAADNYDKVSPWKEVFDPVSWEKLVKRHVVPYLRQGLRELQVTPPRQTDGAFAQVMKWAPLVPALDMVRLLEAEFFGKWRGALHGWLRTARPREGESVAWYEGWKRQFTPELLADELVRVRLEAGLDVINRVAQGAEARAHLHRSRWRAPYR